MTMSEQLAREVERRAAGPTAALLERLAERLGGQAGATAVYGAPVERDGVTVVPVAKVTWGLGVRGATKTTSEDSEPRGGGGVMVAPLGYIEIARGEARFRPIRDPMLLWGAGSLLVAAGLSAWLVLGGLRRLIRG
jgi:uncharacterized spore protein YtfJ